MEKDELGRIRYDRSEPYTNLITSDSLNLNEIRRLQEETLEHISNVRKSGLNVNDYF